MRPRDHVIYGGAAAAALYPVLGSGSLVFWGASVLIDVDHYIDFVYHNGLKDLSFMRMLEYHAVLRRWWRRPEFLNIEVFHTVEAIAPLALLSWWSGSPPLEAATLGMLFHIVLDTSSLVLSGVPFIRAHSVVEYIIRKRLLARRGLDPAALCKEAIRVMNNR
ncbi:MAG: hypothetical protein ACE5GY_00110 [Thermodesulfobacteriota bacterium]